jgi:hypothetical protein
MFKIFKEKIKEAVFDKEAIISELPVLASKMYPKEVLEIHNEFNTAADKLLEEAQAIINKGSTKNVKKVNRLESLGFKQANEVSELKPLLHQVELSKEQIELVNYYKREYPFNKFITEEQVQAICHKYNLVCGDVSIFKGFVPEKNLKEIENFKLKQKDFQEFYCWAGTWDTIANIKIRYGEPDSYFDFARNKNISDKYQKRKGSLKICAPIKDMDISDLELKDGYKLEKHVPDPVVLQPVNGGYLILTAWGDEASDPLVVNEINN